MPLPACCLELFALRARRAADGAADGVGARTCRPDRGARASDCSTASCRPQTCSIPRLERARQLRARIGRAPTPRSSAAPAPRRSRVSTRRDRTIRSWTSGSAPRRGNASPPSSRHCRRRAPSRDECPGQSLQLIKSQMYNDSLRRHPRGARAPALGTGNRLPPGPLRSVQRARALRDRPRRSCATPRPSGPAEKATPAGALLGRAPESGAGGTCFARVAAFEALLPEPGFRRAPRARPRPGGLRSCRAAGDGSTGGNGSATSAFRCRPSLRSEPEERPRRP